MANGVQPGTFQLNGFDETVRSLSSVGTGGTAGTIAIGTKTLTIQDQAGDVFTYDGLYTAAAGGKIVKNGLGTLVLNNFPTSFSGEFVLNTGTLGFGQNNVFGTNANNSKLTINGGTLLKTAGSGAAGSNWNIKNVDINGSFTLDPNGNNNVQILGTAGNVITTLGVDNPTITVPGSTTTGVLIFAGVIQDGPGSSASDIRGLTKDGTGIMTLTGVNTYRGVTTVKAGMLRVAKGTAADGRIGDGTGRVDLSGGTLDYNGSVINTGDPRTLTVPNPVNLTSDSTINYLSTTAALGTTNDITFVFTNNLTGTGGKLTFRNDGACTDNGGVCTFRPTFTSGTQSFGQNVEILNHTTAAGRKTVLTSANTTGTQTWSGNMTGGGHISAYWVRRRDCAQRSQLPSCHARRRRHADG